MPAQPPEDPSDLSHGTRDQNEFFDEEGERLQRFLLVQDSDEYLAVGRNDWAFWYLPGGLDLFVELHPRVGRLVLEGVAVMSRMGRGTEPGTVRAADLREIPLGRLEAILNDRRRSEAIRRASARDTNVYDFTPGQCRGPLGPEDPQRAHELPAVPAPIPGLEIPGIDRQAGTRPLDFYIDVAHAWSTAVAEGHRSPAATIAEANGVSTSMVHRWVREARRRNVMAPSPRAIATRQEPDFPVQLYRATED